MVPQEGFEPPTHALRMRCSTPELLRQALWAAANGAALPYTRLLPGRNLLQRDEVGRGDFSPLPIRPPSTISRNLEQSANTPELSAG